LLQALHTLRPIADELAAEWLAGTGIMWIYKKNKDINKCMVVQQK